MCPDQDPDSDPDDPSPSRPVRAGAETGRELLDLARARAAGRRLVRLRRALASIFIATGAPAAALGWSGLVRTSQGVPVPIPVLVLGVTAMTVAPLVIWALCREWQNDRHTEELLTLVQLQTDDGQASAPRAAT
jgi:hypothetical protein